jgi:hypothetical protein
MASAAAEFPRPIDGGPAYRAYPKEPGPYLHQELLDFSKRTARPEEFPGLHPGPIPHDEPFVILGNIDIDKSRRPAGDLIPCAMCTPNRFLQGKHIYVPRFQCVTIIGHCCADKDTLASATQTFDAKVQKESEENYLLKALPLVGSKLDVLEAVQAKAVEGRRLHRLFNRNASHILDYLRNIRRNGGTLTVSTKIPIDHEAERFAGPAGYKRDEEEQYKTTQIGTLHGLCIAVAKYEPDRELILIRQALSQLSVQRDEEETFYYVADLSDSDRESQVTLLRNIDRTYSRFSKRLAEFVSFFEEDNIALLNKWGKHPDNLLNIHARFERPPYGLAPGTRRFVVGNPQGQAVMLVSNVLWKALPHWEYVSFD